MAENRNQTGEREGKQTDAAYESVFHSRISEKTNFESYYRHLIDSLEDYAVFTTDKHGNILSWNKGSENILQYKEDEIIGKNISILFLEKDLKIGGSEKELVTALTNGRAVDERFHLKKDRSEFWASGLMFPLFDENKNHIGFTKILRDLTERKTAEQALVNAKEFFKSIVDTVREPLVVLNKDLTIATANRSFYNVFKVKKQDIKGQLIYELDSGKWNTEKLKEILEMEIPENNSFEGLEVEYESVPTGKRIMLLNARTLYSISNRKEMILLAIEDVTERKELEQQRKDFIGIVSHELKTPVTSLKAFGQVLQSRLSKSGDEKIAGMLQKMDAQVDKLTYLINDLLDATKIEGGKLQFHEELFLFDDLVNEIIEEVQRTTSKHKLVKQNKSDTSIFADRERIGQVLTNLLTNAIKYSPDADKIYINISPGDDSVICSVQDFGIGIPEDKLEKVFERFFRLSGDKLHTFPGIGLGLFISSEIIRRQGGKIWVESKQGKGSTFFFSLPLQAKTN